MFVDVLGVNSGASDVDKDSAGDARDEEICTS